MGPARTGAVVIEIERKLCGYNVVRWLMQKYTEYALYASLWMSHIEQQYYSDNKI